MNPNKSQNNKTLLKKGLAITGQPLLIPIKKIIENK